MKKVGKEFFKLLLKLIIIVAIAAGIYFFVFGVGIISGESMYPRLRDGDLIGFYRLDKTYYNTDVVAYYASGRLQAARIVAQGGDTVDITEEGELIVNDSVQIEEIFYPTLQINGSQIQFPYKVPDGYVFVLGDMRDNCYTDSRVYGAISRSDIEGKVICFYRHRGI